MNENDVIERIKSSSNDDVFNVLTDIKDNISHFANSPLLVDLLFSYFLQILNDNKCFKVRNLSMTLIVAFLYQYNRFLTDIDIVIPFLHTALYSANKSLSAMSIEAVIIILELQDIKVLWQFIRPIILSPKSLIARCKILDHLIVYVDDIPASVVISLLDDPNTKIRHIVRNILDNMSADKIAAGMKKVKLSFNATKELKDRISGLSQDEIDSATETDFDEIPPTLVKIRMLNSLKNKFNRYINKNMNTPKANKSLSKLNTDSQRKDTSNYMLNITNTSRLGTPLSKSAISKARNSISSIGKTGNRESKTPNLKKKRSRFVTPNNSRIFGNSEISIDNSFDTFEVPTDIFIRTPENSYLSHSSITKTNEKSSNSLNNSFSPIHSPVSGVSSSNSNLIASPIAKKNSAHSKKGINRSISLDNSHYTQKNSGNTSPKKYNNSDGNISRKNRSGINKSFESSSKSFMSLGSPKSVRSFNTPVSQSKSHNSILKVGVNYDNGRNSKKRKSYLSSSSNTVLDKVKTSVGNHSHIKVIKSPKISDEVDAEIVGYIVNPKSQRLGFDPKNVCNRGWADRVDFLKRISKHLLKYPKISDSPEEIFDCIMAASFPIHKKVNEFIPPILKEIVVRFPEVLKTRLQDISSLIIEIQHIPSIDDLLEALIVESDPNIILNSLIRVTEDNPKAKSLIDLAAKVLALKPNYKITYSVSARLIVRCLSTMNNPNSSVILEDLSLRDLKHLQRFASKQSIEVKKQLAPFVRSALKVQDEEEVLNVSLASQEELQKIILQEMVGRCNFPRLANAMYLIEVDTFDHQLKLYELFLRFLGRQKEGQFDEYEFEMEVACQRFREPELFDIIIDNPRFMDCLTGLSRCIFSSPRTLLKNGSKNYPKLYEMFKTANSSVRLELVIIFMAIRAVTGVSIHESPSISSNHSQLIEQLTSQIKRQGND